MTSEPGLDRDTGELTAAPVWALSPTIAQLAGALAKAQGAMTSAEFDRTNPHFGSKYMSLASLWTTIRAPLASNGLAVLQLVSADGLLVTVETILVHESGECVRTLLSLTARDVSAQALGSLVTYLRRYALSALVGVVGDDDDDANSADALPSLKTARTAKPKADKPVPAPAPPPEETITREQQRRLFTIARGVGWTTEEIKRVLLEQYGLASSKDIPQRRYDGIVDALEAGPQAPRTAPEDTEAF